MDIANMKYTELKTECARLGLSGKGSKEQLSERLDRFQRGEDSNKIYIAEEDNSDVSPDEVKAENPEKDQSQNLVEGELESKRVEHQVKWDSICARLNLIFAGRVQYSLQENSPPCKQYPNGNYSVVFKGLARKSESINLTAGIDTICREAARYVNRTEVKSIHAGDSMEEAIKKAQEKAG